MSPEAREDRKPHKSGKRVKTAAARGEKEEGDFLEFMVCVLYRYAAKWQPERNWSVPRGSWKGLFQSGCPAFFSAGNLL
ncbi:hypothetical protein CLOM621_06514 [Clostridium sp. M62/1]|nr:hypothetical protein CLOM621_06514 [Clostridium sp. M62/1]